jgi:hypothetical protein
MTKPIPMVIRQFEEFVEFNLRESEELLTLSLPNFVFSDPQITKLHDLRPIVLFRFTLLAFIMDFSVADSDVTQKYRPWLALFLPWILFHAAVSHPRADTPMRLR